MTIERHADWFGVVRTHWRRTTGFLLASREPCLSIRKTEIQAVRGRSLVGREVQELEGWTPPRSWLLAVILCPGDDVNPIVAWARRHKVDPDRVWFYLHTTTPIEVLRPWADAGHDTAQATTVSDWKELHKLYGLALNDRVYADWHSARE